MTNKQTGKQPYYQQSFLGGLFNKKQQQLQYAGQSHQGAAKSTDV